MRLYVANINYEATEGDLRDFFLKAGYIPSSVRICMDRDTGKPRGFAFVEMREGVRRAIEDLNGQEFMGRALVVQEAKPLFNPATAARSRQPGGGRYVSQ